MPDLPQEAQELITLLTQKAEGLVTAADVERMISETLENLTGVNNAEAARKLLFGEQGAEAHAQLRGSKFERFRMGVEDIEFLYDMMTAAQESNPQRYKGPSEELTQAFAHVSNALYMDAEKVRELDQQALDNAFPRVPKTSLTASDRRLLESVGRDRWAGGEFQRSQAYQAAKRAMDTAESGYGQQLVDAQYVGQLWDAAREQAQIFPLFQDFEMNSPTAYLPVAADFPDMLFVSEHTGATDSDYATDKSGSNRIQVDAKKFVIHQVWSGELEEDSMIPFVQFIRAQAELSLAFHGDSLLINGDTTTAATGNINSDDQAPGATSHYLAFNGLLKIGIVDNTANQKDKAGAAITFLDLRQALTRMADTTYKTNWGRPRIPNDLVMVTDIETANAIENLDEFLNWQTNQGRPLAASVAQVGDINGSPIISSMALARAEADGKINTASPSATLLGRILTFNRRGGVIGWRRRVQTEVERLPGRDQNRLIHSLRLGFGRFTPTGAVGGQEWADVIYNIL